MTTRADCITILSDGSRDWRPKNRTRNMSTTARKTTQMHTSNGQLWAAKSWSRLRKGTSTSVHGKKSFMANSMENDGNAFLLKLLENEYEPRNGGAEVYCRARGSEIRRLGP